MNISMRAARSGKNIRNAIEKYPHGWFALGVLALTWAVWINIFPSGRIIAGGDVLQLLDAHDNFSRLHYGWTGRVSLFYALFFLLDSLGVSDSMQLSWYLGFFLFGAYASFYAGSRLLFPYSSRFISMLTALFYATNVYTLYIFTSTWGFTHYQILYVFIPILTGLFVKSLASDDSIWKYGFLLMVFAASGGSFGNPAFALSLAMYFILLTLGLFVFRKERFVVGTVKNILILIIGSILLNLYWILPLAPQVKAGVAGVSVSTDLVLTDVLRKTSNALSDTIRLVQTHESGSYYPSNFPYPSLSWLKPMARLATIIPFFIAIFGVFVLGKKGIRRDFLVFFSLFIVFVLLVARVRFPFEVVNNFLFQLPGFNVLRGYDKMAIYTPFLLASLVLLALNALREKKVLFAVSTSLFFASVVLTSLPFYFGGLQTKLSYAFANDSKKDFRSSKYSALIRIPQEYYDTWSIIDQDASDGKVTRLPFSEGSSIGKVNLPGLGLNAPAPERGFHSKPFVDPNEVYFPHWRFGEDFENASYDPRWIAQAYGLMGVKYIVYHKDALLSSLDAMRDSMTFLERNGLISKVSDNDRLTLYRIDDRYVFPYAYVSSGGSTEMHENVFGVLDKTASLKEYAKAMQYISYLDRHAEIDVHRDSSKDATASIVVSEMYDALWRAEFVDVSGKSHPLERDDRVTYANGWKLGPKDTDGRVIVRYMPIELFYKGSIVSGGALVAVIAGMSAALLRRRKSS